MRENIIKLHVSAQEHWHNHPGRLNNQQRQANEPSKEPSQDKKHLVL